MSGSSRSPNNPIKRGPATEMGAASLDRATISRLIMPELGVVAARYRDPMTDVKIGADYGVENTPVEPV